MSARALPLYGDDPHAIALAYAQAFLAANAEWVASLTEEERQDLIDELVDKAERRHGLV